MTASSSKKPTTTVAAAVAKTAPTDAPEEDAVQVALPNRREFLFYIWGASMALLTAGTGGALYWFLKPRFREGEFGGVFRLSPPFPNPGDEPENFPSGKFWLTNSEDGMVALYKVCTHLGCLYSWIEVNDRFECPCHGSKFELWGNYIEGPAPRSLDRFAMTIKTARGDLVTNEAGDPIPVNNADITEILVDTGNRIKRDGKV